ncbi:MAG: zf-HC2 domain-containing protein [Victivallales bacterium]
MKHTDRETLERYINGDLSALRKLMIRRHLKSCPACSRLTDEIKKGDELVDSLKKARSIYMDFEKADKAGAMFASLETRIGASRMKKQEST